MTTTIQQNAHLEKILTTNPDFEEKLNGLVKKVLKEAQKNLSEAARQALPRDPRQAYKAVRHAVYQKVLGGNINILQRRKAGQRGEAPQSKRGRSDRTEKLMTYKGADRGFILRFLNAGTEERTVKNMNDHSIKRGVDSRPDMHNRKRGQAFKGGLGNRGHIGARNWFPGASHKAMEAAADNLTKLIEAEIVKTMK